MQAFTQRGLFISKVLQGARWWQWSAKVNATGFRQWLGINHCRPKGRKIVGVDQASGKLIQITLGIQRRHAAGAS